MTKISHVRELIRSFGMNDNQRFFSVATAIACDARAAGKETVASQVEEAVKYAEAEIRKTKGNFTPIGLPITLSSELQGLVSGSASDMRLTDLIVDDNLQGKIARFLREHRERDRLRRAGLEVRRKVLMSGPPGTGKGMTAAVIAGELGLPLYKIRLDGVISKFLGETGGKLRLIFEAIKKSPGVYFFDEVDALAASRKSDDVGEARRMLNSLLVMLEEDQSDSIILAATNHPGLLDDAIFRRFDAAFHFGLPTDDNIRRVIQRSVGGCTFSEVDWDNVVAAGNGLSQAELLIAVGDAARTAVLDHNCVVSEDLLLHSLRDRQEAGASKF
ncbi:AAA family ATPase [Rhizobium sp. BK176]|uniref:AAA family ATPase n=1 Tax=Rhizobium sp. BK176 TaxID=2587071 RepID=UPI0021690BD1|nr:ATP-binding protein [Rhizobium sp. BK176]MCS4090090.1 SpoVK/Ycf46/Vps4 family AAA+-type ATPase [Rhizobium sp. BK176]